MKGINYEKEWAWCLKDKSCIKCEYERCKLWKRMSLMFSEEKMYKMWKMKGLKWWKEEKGV